MVWHYHMWWECKILYCYNVSGVHNAILKLIAKLLSTLIFLYIYARFLKNMLRYGSSVDKILTAYLMIMRKS